MRFGIRLRPAAAIAPLLPLALFAAVGACGGRAARAAPAEEPLQRPLAAIAAQRIIVAPAQRLRGADSVGWSSALGAPAAYLRALDDEIAFAFRERQVGGSWVFPPELAAAARRNAAVAPDPYALQVAQLLQPPRSGEPIDLNEPLGGQLRALAALTDARHVLVPVELRFERFPTAQSAPRAVLRVAVVDARLSRVRWLGHAASDSAASFSPAIAAAVAARLADLAAPLP